MRRLTFILLGLLLAFPMTAQKKAILIGVSDYPEGSGWCKLNAHNDVTLLRDLLSSDWDVAVLEDKQATHNGIVSILNETAKSTSLGDTVLVHFSGHGQQMLPIIPDPDTLADMLDEAIIPYDAKKDWSPDYAGQNHLRDNEFGGLIDAIRNKAGVGGLVVVVLDACHSDSMQRDSGGGIDTTGVYRGTSDIFGKVITDEAQKKRFNRDTSKIEINHNATVVYLSACQAYSKNAEITRPDGKGYGSLSYAVAGALNDGGVNDLIVFLDRVVTAMDTLVPYQNPGIRASFEYQRPDNAKVDTPNVSIADKEEGHSKAYIIAIVAAFALLLFVIWRMRRK
jgi:hypothetical protein